MKIVIIRVLALLKSAEPEHQDQLTAPTYRISLLILHSLLNKDEVQP